MLREGDKVMQIRNNYEKEVFNGDIGRIIRIDGGSVTVVYDDGGKPVFTSFEDEYAYAGISGNKIVYTSAEVDELQLAYAMSVHKSQGSEYPVVILLNGAGALYNAAAQPVLHCCNKSAAKSCNSRQQKSRSGSCFKR